MYETKLNVLFLLFKCLIVASVSEKGYSLGNLESSGKLEEAEMDEAKCVVSSVRLSIKEFQQVLFDKIQREFVFHCFVIITLPSDGVLTCAWLFQ